MIWVNCSAQGFPAHVLKDVCELYCRSLGGKPLIPTPPKQEEFDHGADRSRGVGKEESSSPSHLGLGWRCLPSQGHAGGPR